MKDTRFNRSVLMIGLILSICSLASAQKKSPDFHHVEPPFWWTGMKNGSVQILFHNREKDISVLKPETTYPGVTISEVKRVENPHYLFVTLDIAPSAGAGSVPIVFRHDKKSVTYNYQLRAKGSGRNRIQGFNSSDVLYLIMPDRFANGDPSNDSIPGMFEGVHREKGFSRHGGDLKGISDHLDYIKELGVTALWLNPVLENNQKRQSYHGYAITDLYNADRRFGGNQAYISFIDKCHQMGLKVIQDMVMNHIGNDHWLMHDLPEKGWVHQFPEFTRSNYRGTVISDPYRSRWDEQLMSNGWFDTTMPDVDQTNPLFATYLIQNTLWWIEYAGLDGIRMDTYPYPDKDFMAKWASAVNREFPKFNIVGEAWLNNITTTAYWQKDMANKDGYQSFLPTVTDFPFCYAVPQALHEQGGWDSGLARLYNLLSQDFIYPDANSNLTFLDNHDMTRFFLACGRDLNKFRMGLTFLLTTRGIPQLYYGTELLMDGDGGHHPNVRLDFPGGWKDDPANAFVKEGRTAVQNEAFDFMKSLLNWRKGESLVHTGKLTHYVPQDNIYVYFRSNGTRSIMVIMNGNSVEKPLDMKRYQENIKGAKTGVNVLTKEALDLGNLVLKPLSALVVEIGGVE
jgi:neopullulanase